MNPETHPKKEFRFKGRAGAARNADLRVLTAFALLMLSSLAVYSNTLQAPFAFDDKDNIENNPAIRLTRLDKVSISRAARGLLPGRPVANLSFALNYFLHGYSVLGYHLVNILLHGCNGLLLFSLIRITLGLSCDPNLRAGPEKDPEDAYHDLAALFAAWIWTLHPVQTESVSYIVQRMNSLAAFFYLASLLFYIHARRSPVRWRRWAGFILCALSALAALGSKENAVTVPVFLFLYEWYFFQDLNGSWIKGKAWAGAGIAVALLLVASLYLGGNPLRVIAGGYTGRDFSLLQRLLTEFRVVVFYMGLLLFPSPGRLNLDYDFPLSYSLWTPLTTLPSVVLVIGLLAAAILFAKKRRILSFCMLWFFGNLIVESSVLPLEIIFEHRLYLPSMLFFLPLVRVVSRWPKRIGWILLVPVLGVLSLWTYERNRVWTDDVALLADCVNKSPNKARPHYGLAVALAERGDLDGAASHLATALAIEPGHLQALNTLGSVLARKGENRKALDTFHLVLAIDPAYGGAYYNLGKAYRSAGEYKAAAASYRMVLKLGPPMPEALFHLSWILSTAPDSSIRNGPESLALARHLVRIVGPAEPLALDALAAALAETGRYPEAEKTARRARDLAAAAGLEAFSSAVEKRRSLYASGVPYRQGGGGHEG